MNYSAWKHPQGKPSIADIPTVWQPDVPVDRYKYNLRRIVKLGRVQGAEVWLLTSPHAPATPKNVSRYVKAPNAMANILGVFNAIPTFERLVEIHETCNDAVREVGRELVAPVVDLDAQYDRNPNPILFGDEDPAHPTQMGHLMEAETLYQRLLEKGVVKPIARASNAATR